MNARQLPLAICRIGERFGADENERVAGLQIERGALQPNRGGSDAWSLHPTGARPQRAQRLAGGDVLDGLEDLGGLSRSRRALRLRADGKGERGRRTRRGVEREGERDARGDAGVQLVTDQPRKLQHAAQFRRRAQIILLCELLLVERQDVGDHREGVEQGDGKIVRRARGQRRERRPVESDSPAIMLSRKLE